MLNFNYKLPQVNKGVGLGSKLFVEAADEKPKEGPVIGRNVCATEC